MNGPSFNLSLDRRFWWVCLGLLAFFAAIYFTTLFPSPGGRVNYGDSAKWHFLWMVDGTPHSPGYPLFLVLTELFGRFATFMPPEQRVTLLSLCSALLCLGFLGATVYSWTRSALATATAMFIMGTAASFWSQATEAEVYTLNGAFVAAVIYCFSRFMGSGRRGWLYTGSAIYALSFGNHLTMVTLLPAIFYAVWVTDRKLFTDWRATGLVVLIAMLGACQYLYLMYLSHYGTGVNESYVTGLHWSSHWREDAGHLEFIGRNADWATFFAYITGGQFGDLMGQSSFAAASRDFSEQLINKDWGFLVLLVFFYAAVVYRERQSSPQPEGRLMIFLAIALVGQLAYTLGYDIPDREVYFIAPLVPMTVLGILLVTRLKYARQAFVLLIVITLAKGTANYRSLNDDIDDFDYELRQLLAPLALGDDLYFERQGFFAYPGFGLLNFYRYCEDCDFRVNASSDIRAFADKDEIWAAALSQATIEELQKTYEVEAFDPGAQIRGILDDLGPDRRLIVAGNQFDIALVQGAVVPQLQAAGSEHEFRDFAGAYLGVASDKAYVEISSQFNVELEELPDRLGLDPSIIRAEVQAMDGLAVKYRIRLEHRGKNLSWCSAGVSLLVYDLFTDDIVRRIAICGNGTVFPSGKLYRLSKKPVAAGTIGPN